MNAKSKTSLPGNITMELLNTKGKEKVINAIGETVHCLQGEHQFKQQQTTHRQPWRSAGSGPAFGVCCREKNWQL